MGVKSVQNVKMGHAQKVIAQEDNKWDLEQPVRETEKTFSSYLQLLMDQTKNDPTLLKTLPLRDACSAIFAESITST